MIGDQRTAMFIIIISTYIGMDEEMLALINRTLEKLWFLTDEAFLDLDLEPPVKQERCRMLLFFCVLNNGEFLCIIKP